jgi:hypothetical protein
MSNVNVRESLCASINNEHYTHNKIFDKHIRQLFNSKNKTMKLGLNQVFTIPITLWALPIAGYYFLKHG